MRGRTLTFPNLGGNQGPASVGNATLARVIPQLRRAVEQSSSVVNIIKAFGCMFSHHDWTNSHKKRRYMTCKTCGWRRKWR
jgi:hypothetical protein